MSAAPGGAGASRVILAKNSPAATARPAAVLCHHALLSQLTDTHSLGSLPVTAAPCLPHAHPPLPQSQLLSRNGCGSQCALHHFIFFPTSHVLGLFEREPLLYCVQTWYHIFKIMILKNKIFATSASCCFICRSNTLNKTCTYIFIICKHYMWNGFSGFTESLQKTQHGNFAELTEWLKCKQGVK